MQQARQHGPAAVCAGGVLLEHRGAAGRAHRRPWLTLAMDVDSRMVAGFLISLDPPCN